MVKLTKELAAELDEFLKLLSTAKNGQQISFDKLPIDRKKALDLLYIIKTFEPKTAPILAGDSLLFVHWLSLRAFLGQGGFNAIYQNEKMHYAEEWHKINPISSHLIKNALWYLLIAVAIFIAGAFFGKSCKQNINQQEIKKAPS